jgi:hypothetical protein
VLWAWKVRKPNFWNLGIEVTRGWESLHHELPGTEDQKTQSDEVPKTSMRVSGTETPKPEVLKFTKLSRARKIHEIETFS